MPIGHLYVILEKYLFRSFAPFLNCLGSGIKLYELFVYFEY